jgi:hypothetical protein
MATRGSHEYQSKETRIASRRIEIVHDVAQRRLGKAKHYNAIFQKSAYNNMLSS